MAKRVILTTEVGRQAWVDCSSAGLPPVDPVYVRGPRGGLWRAVGPWTRHVDDRARWDMNLLTIIDLSAASVYVRPGRKVWTREEWVRRAAHQ
jgi:hypothetical protein